MKPDIDTILNLSAAEIMSTLAPALPTGYAQGTASIISMLMMFSAQEHERGADIRHTENQNMRALFAKLAADVSDAGLRTKIEIAAKTKDETFGISALNAANYELKRLLIALQIYFESEETKSSQNARREIWKILKAGADARVLSIPASA